MRSKIGLRDFIERGLKSRIGKNVLSLYLLQFSNYILPLITVPYLVRILGPEKYGIVGFAQSFIAYFALIVNYGFDWSATRSISVHRDDVEKISEIFSSVLLAKTLLFVSGFLLFLPLVLFIPKLNSISMIALILYGSILGNLMFPTWLFQGKENMVQISVINLSMRFVGTISIFLLIHNQSDYLLYVMVIALQGLGAGILGLWKAFKLFKVQLIVVPFRSIWIVLKEGWVLFLSTGAVSFYASGNAFILGLLTNPTVVGYYVAAERIIRAFVGLLEPISQAVYPRVNKLASEGGAGALDLAFKALAIMFIAGFSFSLILIIAAPLISNLLLGQNFLPSITVMRILSVLPLMVGVSNVFGIQIMLPFGHDKFFTYILFGASVVNIALAIIFAPLWQASGMAMAVVLSEVFVTVAMLLYLEKVHLNPLRKQQQT